MSFEKALQRTTLEIEGQKEWTQAYELYCKQCSVNAQMLKTLRGRTDDAAELLRFRQKREFSAQCKEFNKASSIWATQQINHRLRQKGVKDPVLSVFEQAKILEVKLAMTGRDLAELERTQRIISNTSPERLEAMRQAALSYQRNTTTESYAKYDPTNGDFNPLPVNEEEHEEEL